MGVPLLDVSLVLHPTHFLALLSNSLLGVNCTAASSQAGALEASGARGLHGPVCPWLCHRQRPELRLTQALPWQVLALARQQNKRVKVVGGGHSPSDIACTDGFMIHMGKMNRVLQVLAALSSASAGPQPWPPSQTPSRSSLASPRWPDPLPAPESQSDTPIPDPQSRALPGLAQASCQFCTPVAMVRMSTPFSARAHIPFGYLEWEVA